MLNSTVYIWDNMVSTWLWRTICSSMAKYLSCWGVWTRMSIFVSPQIMIGHPKYYSLEPIQLRIVESMRLSILRLRENDFCSYFSLRSSEKTYYTTTIRISSDSISTSNRMMSLRSLYLSHCGCTGQYYEWLDGCIQMVHIQGFQRVWGDSYSLSAKFHIFFNWRCRDVDHMLVIWINIG